ncbi:MAG: hypothetical protein HZB10_01770 [Candidatus Yonathbacteria bacterium]|nr:hypothetical protein [Candidatus Yonathbacteria bacterium]
MTIWISVFSIFVITAFVMACKRILPFSRCVTALCAICAGVSLTWIGLLVASFVGYPIDIRIPAILMGGTVVGIAYQGGRFLPVTRSELLWKSVFIPIGFALVFTILDRQWSMAFAMFTALAAVIAWSFLPWLTTQSQNGKEQVDSLEKKMKNCC